MVNVVATTAQPQDETEIFLVCCRLFHRVLLLLPPSSTYYRTTGGLSLFFSSHPRKERPAVKTMWRHPTSQIFICDSAFYATWRFILVIPVCRTEQNSQWESWLSLSLHERFSFFAFSAGARQAGGKRQQTALARAVLRASMTAPPPCSSLHYSTDEIENSHSCNLEYTTHQLYSCIIAANKERGKSRRDLDE